MHLQVSQWYDLVVFSASSKRYAHSVCDELDKKRKVFRKIFHKKVFILDYKFQKVVII